MGKSRKKMKRINAQKEKLRAEMGDPNLARLLAEENQMQAETIDGEEIETQVDEQEQDDWAAVLEDMRRKRLAAAAQAANNGENTVEVAMRNAQAMQPKFASSSSSSSSSGSSGSGDSTADDTQPQGKKAINTRRKKKNRTKKAIEKALDARDKLQVKAYRKDKQAAKRERWKTLYT